MDGGHRAVIFDRLAGVRDKVMGEGMHLMVPWVQKPIIFDITPLCTKHLLVFYLI